MLWHREIFATHEERQDLASGPWPEDERGVALPCKEMLGKNILVKYGANEVIVKCVDIGPFCIDDTEYCLKGDRPRAEVLKGEWCPRSRQGGCATVPFNGGWREVQSNGAGIDLLPGTAKDLGIPIGHNVFVDWVQI